MIVRNEADNLKRCLQSVHQHVDRIVVTDTGSSDSTRDVALGFGTEVREFPWCHDFSAARNHSIQGVAEDWILCLDADDYFPECEAGKLRGAIQQTSFVAMTIDYKVLAGHTPAPGLKLFKNHLGIRFEGIIHEYIRNSLELISGARIGHAKILLEHTGYSPELVIAKRPRNIPLLRREQQRASLARDFRQMLYVGKTLGSQLIDDGSEAEGKEILISLLEDSLKLGLHFPDDWQISILANLISFLHEKENNHEALFICTRFEGLFQGHPLMSLYRGLCRFRMRQFQGALEDLLEFQKIVTLSPLRLAVPEKFLEVDLWEILGHCYLSLGQFAQAATELSRCLEADPRPEHQIALKLAQRLSDNEATTRT